MKTTAPISMIVCFGIALALAIAGYFACPPQVRTRIAGDIMSPGPGLDPVLDLSAPSDAVRVYGWVGDGIEVGEVGRGPCLSLPDGVELNVLGL